MLDPRPTFAYLVTALRDKHPKLAYLHAIEPRVDGMMDKTPKEDEDNEFVREIWKGGEGGKDRIFISAGGYTRETALRTAEDKGELIAFGRSYIPNVSVVPIILSCSSVDSITKPDLPMRLRKNLALASRDRSTYFVPGSLTPLGYSGWPFADGIVEGIDEVTPF